MKNPMVEKSYDVNLLEEIDENTVVAGAWTIFKLSPLSKVLGNKGAVCTGTIECQNNCR